MKNFVQEGEVVPVVAPYNVTSGQGVLVGSLFGVAAYDALAGANVEVKTEGVFDITALAADVGAQGVKIYWDNANRRLTVTAAGSQLVGVLTVAKVNGDLTARAYLDGAIR